MRTTLFAAVLLVPSIAAAEPYDVQRPLTRGANSCGTVQAPAAIDDGFSARYLLPVSADLGDAALGASYVYYSDQLAVSETASPNYYEIDSYELVNFNLNWDRIAGSAFDASLFVTNAFDEEYSVYRSGLWEAGGFETSMTGLPRMFGARVRYNFGAAD